jgi:hypothetical protein
MSYWKQTRPAPYDQEMTRRSIAQFERFLTLFPDHPNAAEIKQYRLTARDRLAEKAFRNGRLYLKLHHWDPARYYFALVRSDYPRRAGPSARSPDRPPRWPRSAARKMRASCSSTGCPRSPIPRRSRKPRKR